MACLIRARRLDTGLVPLRQICPRHRARPRLASPPPPGTLPAGTQSLAGN